VWLEGLGQLKNPCLERKVFVLNMQLVWQVVPGGIAARSGKLRMGDRILKVNGEDVTKSSHQEAVQKLLKPGDEIVLTIQHDPLPEGYQVGILQSYDPQLCSV
jgi:C-terminal processing protease CtpA/Prc